jgi:hypothetical protein
MTANGAGGADKQAGVGSMSAFGDKADIDDDPPFSGLLRSTTSALARLETIASKKFMPVLEI